MDSLQSGRGLRHPQTKARGSGLAAKARSHSVGVREPSFELQRSCLTAPCFSLWMSRSLRDLCACGSPAVGLTDALGLVAQRAERGVVGLLPAGRDRNEAPFFGQGFEGEPTSAIPFGQCNPSLVDGSPVHPASTLGTAPVEALRVSAVIRGRAPLDLARLRIPHLPVRAVSVYKSPV